MKHLVTLYAAGMIATAIAMNSVPRLPGDGTPDHVLARITVTAMWPAFVIVFVHQALNDDLDFEEGNL